MNGKWRWNGLQIKAQAITYTQFHICNSMLDPDMFLLQMCSTQLSSSVFLKSVLECFNVFHLLSLSSSNQEQEQADFMMESALIFLTSVITLRTNLGLPEQDLPKLEMLSLLFMKDQTFSQVKDHMPQKPNKDELYDEDIERYLNEVSTSIAPPGGSLQQRMYAPKQEMWETMYDPIHVWLRAGDKQDFQNSLERFYS